MSDRIISSSEELKTFYLETDITDTESVQSAIKVLLESDKIFGKEKYLEALNAAIPSNVSKAQKYSKINFVDGIKGTVFKNIGWIVMVIFVILIVAVDSDYEDAITTWLSLGFWIGVGVQIYISVLKSAWNKLTLNGTVVHSVLKK